MSLLMEAIRKAEEARRQSDEKNAPATETATILTLSADPPSASPPVDPPVDPLPGLARRLDAVDDDLAAMAIAPPVKRPALAGDRAEERAAARMIFAAGQPSNTNTDGSALGPIVGVGILALLGVAGYFWWQLQGIPPPVAATAVYHAPAVPLPPAAESDTARPASEASSPLPSPPPAEDPMPPRVPATPSPPAYEPVNSAPAAPPRQETAGKEPRLSRAPARVNLALERAYEALQSGRNGEAQGLYEQALRADGKNTDALLGLATLAARQGQADKAHGYYLRALETDPADPTARAGVLSMESQGDADAAEGLLETALARQPGSPPLLFALGNLYARQQRWSEAQEAYFQAYTGEPGDPDIIFNLAVSLDHLRQGTLAAQYYRMALTAAEGRTADFDRNHVERRLNELQP
ncbi:MAG: tetratricopeptide repeat protein [Candidatus Accumulibacter sp.]|jgi:Tfp pilus assembly protein PilF|nr:tetratricopeptide repeat protein [Accumulibacter sp.]